MVIIREMQENDVGMVAELESRIFSQPWSSRAFLESLRLGNTVYLTAGEEGKLLGYAGMYTAMDEGEIVNVAVAPEKRGCGIGAMLIRELKRAAEARRIERIVLEVRVSNRTAIHLYEKAGFICCGIRKDFYEFPREDAYIMIYGQ